LLLPESDAWSQWVGGRVGAEAVKVLLGMSQTRVTEVPVDFRTRLWDIPRRKPAPARVQAARELLEKYDTGLSNFENDVASVFVHFGEAQTQTWLLVRLPSPEIPPGPVKTPDLKAP
jgi:hypothetical protein